MAVPQPVFLTSACLARIQAWCFLRFRLRREARCLDRYARAPGFKMLATQGTMCGPNKRLPWAIDAVSTLPSLHLWKELLLVSWPGGGGWGGKKGALVSVTRCLGGDLMSVTSCYCLSTLRSVLSRQKSSSLSACCRSVNKRPSTVGSQAVVPPSEVRDQDIWKSPTQNLPASQQHSSQSRKGGNHPDVHQLVSG